MGALLACRGGWPGGLDGTEVHEPTGLHPGGADGAVRALPGAPSFHRVGMNAGSYEEVQRFVYVGEGKGRFSADELERQGARDEQPAGPSRVDAARLFYVCIMVFFVLAGVICVGISFTSEHSHEDRSMAAVTDSPLVASDDAAEATAAPSALSVNAAAESTLAAGAPNYAGYDVSQTESTNGSGDALLDCAQSPGAAWPREKAVRCCAEQGVGCPELDCDAGFLHWEKEWSEGKKEWCCSQQGKGCTFAS